MRTFSRIHLERADASALKAWYGECDGTKHVTTTGRKARDLQYGGLRSLKIVTEAIQVVVAKCGKERTPLTIGDGGLAVSTIQEIDKLASDRKWVE